MATPISFTWDPQQTYSWPILAPSQNAGIWFWTFGSIQLTHPQSFCGESYELHGANQCDPSTTPIMQEQLMTSLNSPQNISSLSEQNVCFDMFSLHHFRSSPRFLSLRKFSSQVTNFHGLLFHLAQVLEEVEHLFAIPTAIQPGKGQGTCLKSFRGKPPGKCMLYHRVGTAPTLAVENY